EGALGASGGARKYGGRRQAGDVDVAGRRPDRERERRVAAWTAQIRGLVERGEARAQTRDERVEVTCQSRLNAVAGVGEVGGSREPRALRTGHGGLPREEVLGAAPEIGGLVQRGQVGVQSRHETIVDADKGALGAPARAGKVRRPRAPAGVDVARRRYDRERAHFLGTAAAEERRLLERGQVAVQPRHEPIIEATERALSPSVRSWQVAGVRETGDVDVSRRRLDRERQRVVVIAAADVCGLLERGETRVQPRDET